MGVLRLLPSHTPSRARSSRVSFSTRGCVRGRQATCDIRPETVQIACLIVAERMWPMSIQFLPRTCRASKHRRGKSEALHMSKNDVGGFRCVSNTACTSPSARVLNALNVCVYAGVSSIAMRLLTQNALNVALLANSAAPS